MFVDDILEAVHDAGFDVDVTDIFTISKAAFTIYGIYHATGLWSDSPSSLAQPAVRLLGLNAGLVFLITLYKLTRREIAPLFVLQCLGHYSNFLIFVALAGFGSHPKIKKGRRGDRRIGLAIWTLHALYLVVLVTGFCWAKCEEGSIYPISFLMINTLFLLSYSMLLYVKRRDFDGDDARGVRLAGDKNGKEDLELWNAQVTAFFKQQRLLALWYFAEMVCGYVLLNQVFPEAVTCDDRGEAWVLHSTGGKAFLLMHTFGVKQGLGVASKVFSKTVKKLHKKRGKKGRKEE